MYFCDIHEKHNARTRLCSSAVIEAAASKYTYVTEHDNKSFRRCVGVYITWGMISSWRDSETVAKAQNDLRSSYVGFTRRNHSNGNGWSGVLSRRLTYLCIFIGRHIVPFLRHNALACAIIDSKYVCNCWYCYGWLLYAATSSKFMLCVSNCKLFW